MRRGGAGAGGRRLPKSSLAPSAAEATPGLDPVCRNLDYAFNRRDSDASLCSSRPPSSIGVRTASAAPNFSDRATQAAALRIVNNFLAPAVNLRPPLPAARDILAAFRCLLDRIGFHLLEKESTIEDDLFSVLPVLGCPYRLTRSTLKAPGTPHSWPPLLAVLHWLTIMANISSDTTSSSSFNDLMLYTTQGYAHFIVGDDDDVAAVDDEYVNKARAHGEALVETIRALEKETQELEEKRIKLTSGPSRVEAMKAEKAILVEDIHKFESVVKTWSAKISEREEVNVNEQKEVDAKLMEAQHLASQNQELLKKVEAQAVNVRDVERMKMEMQLVDNDITKLKNAMETLEDKVWELDSLLVKNLQELEGLAEQCNQDLKRLKPSIDFQYSLNANGSSPADLLGLSYKTQLKPGLKAYAEENKRISTSKLRESVVLQKQWEENVKVLEGKRNNISTLQDKTDEMVTRLITLDHEIKDDDSKCSAEARQMKTELEAKLDQLNTIEKEAADILNTAEQKLNDTLLRTKKETQECAGELLQVMKSVVEHREFMEAAIAQRKKEVYETADYIASLPSKM